jgi:hypothetical protein
MRRIAVLLCLGGLATSLPAMAQEPAASGAQAPSDAASAAATAASATPVAPSSATVQTAQPAATAASAAAAPALPAVAAGGVNGLWCGSGPLRDYSLRLAQRQQDVEGELARPGRTRTIEGRIEGNVLRTQSTKVGALVLEHKGNELKITGGDGPIALARGQVFRRSPSGTCPA